MPSRMKSVPQTTVPPQHILTIPSIEFIQYFAYGLQGHDDQVMIITLLSTSRADLKFHVHYSQHPLESVEITHLLSPERYKA